ncbi:unnamed protein product [Spirodela intermedia]|uniref:Uncharacterized protein n=1 Tax=Spirodela intermedia TaxID=51605 RepID=A0A7I8JQD2_SPIIN|nr:unnamed protein product [Spirodela intermedia]CAA6672377.1 unnamed protein product [Spirodela intermedia]
MASAVFKSSTRRSAVGSPNDAGSSSRSGECRRSRSLSRYSGRVPPPGKEEVDDFRAPPRGKFVNTARGSGFPEISLDDLADEFFAALEFEDEVKRGRGRGRVGLAGGSLMLASSWTRSRRRGGGGQFRGRAVWRAMWAASGSESDFSCNSSSQNKLRTSQKRNCESFTSHKPSTDNTLRRARSQRDLRYLQDSHSRYSSALTDDESHNVHTNTSGAEKTIGTVFDHKKHPLGDGENDGLYEVMRKEVRHAVDEIRTELEKVIEKAKPPMPSGNDPQPKSSEVVQAIAEIRRNYTSKLEESEKRKQDLLAELAAEEQRGQELSKIVKELLPGTNQTTPVRQSRFRKRSNDKSKISKHLFEEAEKYFEDFISSVDDTDISSFDGEKSDGGSTIGGCTKSNAVGETQAGPARTASSLVDTDGLVLPWLEWETFNDGTPLSGKSKEPSALHSSVRSMSSHGSCSPGNTHERSSSFSMDDYAHLEHVEDFLFEVLLQRRRIDSGTLVLCGRISH